MPDRCTRCRSEPRKGAVYCDQCGVKLGTRAARGEKAMVWLLALATLAATAAIVLLLTRRWDPEGAARGTNEVGAIDTRSSGRAPPGGDERAPAAEPRRPVPPEARAPRPAVGARSPLGICVYEADRPAGSLPRAAGGAVLGDGRAILPLSLLMGAHGVAGASSAGEFEIQRILAMDPARDLALAAISPAVPGDLVLRTARPGDAGTGQSVISPLRGVGPVAAGRPARAASLARLGDLFVTDAGVLESMTTAPARSLELRGGPFSGPELQLVVVEIAGALWETVDLAMPEFQARVYAESARGMFELAQDQRDAGDLPGAWFTVRKLIGTVGPEGFPGLPELHEDVLFAHADALEAAVPGSSSSVLFEAAGSYPGNARILARLGLAQAVSGRLREALATLRQAAALSADGGQGLLPEIVGAHVRHLAQSRELGAPGEAAGELELSIANLPPSGSLHYLLALAAMDQGFLGGALEELDRASELSADLREEIAAARKEIERRLQPGSTVVLEFPPSATSVLVDVTLNDRRTATLILDTGATRTALSHSIAAALGLQPSQRTIKVSTAGGVFNAPTVLLASLSLQSLRVESLEAVLLDLPGTSGQPVDGLLGNDFLRNFRLEIDHDQGTLTLSPR